MARPCYEFQQNPPRLIRTVEAVVSAWLPEKKPLYGQRDMGLIKQKKGIPGRPNPNRPGASIPVHINFDATEEVEVWGEVKPA